MPEMKSLNSTSIKAAGYDEGSRTLYLEFNGGGKYAYDGVGKDVYDGFFAKGLKSVGGHFRDNLKSHKQFRRLK